MIIGKTRTNQPVEGDNDALALSLAGKDIAPKDVNATGKVSGNEIIENMSGYSFQQAGAIENVELTYIYAGCVKTGNKLTLVCFFSFKRTDAESGATGDLGRFIIPKSIGDKIYPYTVSGDPNICELKQIQAYSNLYTKVDIDMRLQKGSSDATHDYLLIGASGMGSLTVNTEYLIRFETTFLLNDNLAPEQVGE